MNDYGRGALVGLAQFVAIVAVLLAFMIATGHCATTSKRNNAFGAVTYNENPNTYVAGSVTNVSVVGNYDGIVFRIQPLGTYQLFTQDILFCPQGVTTALQNKRNPVVITYERAAHRTVQGIGCHKLLHIDNLETTKELP